MRLSRIIWTACAGLLLGTAVGAQEQGQGLGPERPLENIGLPNWAGQDYAPQISPDGQFLIFQSDRPGRNESQNLWVSRNQRFTERMSPAQWSIPVPLSLPLSGDASKTMQIVRPQGALEDPPGGFSVNTDGFEGMASLVYRKDRAVEIYFTALRDVSGRDGYAGLNIYVSVYRDQRWSVPRHLNVVNSHFDDRMPVVSHDGAQMYFVSNRPGGFGGNDLWYAERDLSTGLWSPPVNAGAAMNTRFNEISPTLSVDARMLFFSSDRPGGFGHYDLYMNRKQAGLWEPAKNLGENFNSERDDESLTMTHDSLWAYFASDRRHPGARGDFDVYRRGVPDWLRMNVQVLFLGQVLDGGTRRPLGVEATIKIFYERETLIRTSTIFRKDPDLKDPQGQDDGGQDLFNNFSIELNAGRRYRVQFSAPGFEPQELVLNYSEDTPPGKIDRRIIVLRPIKIDPIDPPTRNREISGVVVDALTRLALPGSRVTLTVDGSEPTPVPLDNDARFTIVVPEDRAFQLRGQAPDYLTRTMEFPALNQRPDDGPGMDSPLVLPLQPVGGPPDKPCPENNTIECLLNLKTFFAFRESTIQKSAVPVLNAAARIMKANPGTKIQIVGHTDRVGSLEYNQRLSEARARSVRDALIARGIAADRLIIQGKSFLQPLDPANRDLNRRVEFRRHN
ncbi:MAG: OmpA family protein [bacterium]|nr:OmpA family protein [bacterium]